MERLVMTGRKEGRVGDRKERITMRERERVREKRIAGMEEEVERKKNKKKKKF
jgi:hypothetical protein